MSRNVDIYNHDSLKEAAHAIARRKHSRSNAVIRHLSKDRGSDIHTAAPKHVDFHLSEHGQNKIRAINNLLRPQAHDIVLVYGDLGDPARSAVLIEHIATVSQNPLKDVLSEAAAVYKENGKCDLDVYVTPLHGMHEKSHHQHDWHFSICSDADWHRLLDPEHSDHSKKARMTEADRLISTLEKHKDPAKPEMKIVQNVGMHFHHH